MILLTVDEMIELHQKLVDATGGSAGLRDRGLLESAVYSVDASFDDIERYPTVEEKAARLAYSLIHNHAFVDGNKRIGVYIMLTFLEVNGIRLECTDDELVHVGLSVADGSMDYEQLLAWVREHRI